jgi:hypothetical protein
VNVWPSRLDTIIFIASLRQLFKATRILFPRESNLLQNAESALMRHTGVSIEGPAKVESIIRPPSREQLPRVIGSAARIYLPFTAGDRVGDFFILSRECAALHNIKYNIIIHFPKPTSQTHLRWISRAHSHAGLGVPRKRHYCPP